MKPIGIGIVGVGKIARDQHIPAIRANGAFDLLASASRNAGIEGIQNFPSVEAMLDGAPQLDAVAICTPPQVHYETAKLALSRGKHVFLEKPPCLTTVQLDELAACARKAKRTLFQSWHSQHAAGVIPARSWLKDRAIKGGQVTWKEDVRRWHPGQLWIWQAGGFGIFDPGINAISILTTILPQSFFAQSATLYVPENCETPIAADVEFATGNGAHISASMDFRHEGEQTWDIDIETADGTLKLSQGGSKLFIDGKSVNTAEHEGEYPSLYRRFAALIAQNLSEVDARPFQIVADIFLIAKRVTVARFEDRG